MTYDVGDQPRLYCPFYVDDVLTDPTTVSLTVRKPDGTSTTYSLAGGTVGRESLGLFYRDQSIDQSGNWYYTWTATGTVNTAEAGEFYVRVRRA